MKRILTLIFALLLTPLAASHAADSKPAKPNFVVILIDAYRQWKTSWLRSAASGRHFVDFSNDLAARSRTFSGAFFSYRTHRQRALTFNRDARDIHTLGLPDIDDDLRPASAAPLRNTDAARANVFTRWS